MKKKQQYAIIAIIAVIAAAIAIHFVQKNQRDKEVEAELAALEAGEAEKLQASAEFIAAKAKEEGVKMLQDSVCYKALAEEVTDGEALSSADEVMVTYEMKLPDGTIADSRETPIKMRIGNLIPGAQIAMTQMHVGDDWEIYIPQEKGYGTKGAGKIPPYSALVFHVKIVGKA